uniref:Uncharacterized protein n=1 Tax=Oryza glumipatula TaxID=40148 RepID=A0A0E0A6L3_9ORYZ
MASAASPGDARPRCTALQNLPLTLLVSDLALLHCVPLLPPPPLRSPLTRSPDGRRRPRWCPPSLRRSRRRRRLCGCLCHLENDSSRWIRMFGEVHKSDYWLSSKAL